MKIKNLSLLSIPFIAVLTACKPTQVRLYNLGETYQFNDCTVSASLDKANERFVLDFKTNKKDAWYDFSFRFCANGNDIMINNKDELNTFVYRLSDGEEITFNDDGYYVFHSDTTINVFYTYASQVIKEAIDNKTYNITFGGKIWIGY